MPDPNLAQGVAAMLHGDAAAPQSAPATAETFASVVPTDRAPRGGGPVAVDPDLTPADLSQDPLDQATEGHSARLTPDAVGPASPSRSSEPASREVPVDAAPHPEQLGLGLATATPPSPAASEPSAGIFSTFTPTIPREAPALLDTETVASVASSSTRDRARALAALLPEVRLPRIRRGRLVAVLVLMGVVVAVVASGHSTAPRRSVSRPPAFSRAPRRPDAASTHRAPSRHRSVRSPRRARHVSRRGERTVIKRVVVRVAPSTPAASPPSVPQVSRVAPRATWSAGSEFLP